MVEKISEGIRKARKPHRCFHCYRDIPKGEVYGFETNKYDHVYTIRYHLDCDDLAQKWFVLSGTWDYDEEGIGPLRDQWRDSGEYEDECNAWRGYYPHVIARMELSDQLREARR